MSPFSGKFWNLGTISNNSKSTRSNIGGFLSHIHFVKSTIADQMDKHYYYDFKVNSLGTDNYFLGGGGGG